MYLDAWPYFYWRAVAVSIGINGMESISGKVTVNFFKCFL